MKVKTADEQSRKCAVDERLASEVIEDRQQSSAPGRLKPWHGSLFSAAVTTATLALRLALDAQLRGRPTLIVFTLPIMVSGYVGGLGGGLLATAISCVGAGYFLLPPVHTFRIEAGVDRWDLLFLFLAGVVISVLNEALHRARRESTIAAGKLQLRSALVKSQALQSAIFNSTGFSSIATDEKGVIQIFNVGAERMLGYTAAEVVHRLTPAEMADPEEMIARAQTLSTEFKTPIAPGLETLIYKASRGMEYVYEPTLIRKDGSRFPAVVSVAALRDTQDAIIGYLLIGTDNTARKRAEEDRQRFFKLSQDVLCTLGFDGYFKELNPAWETTLGYTRAELLAIPFIEFVHPDDHPATLAGAQRVFGGESLFAFENRYRCKDGTYRWFQWNVTPVMEDRVMYGVARDVTQRKQTEAALLKAGALQRAIFNSANFSSIATDAKGVIQIFNVGAERMLGYTAAEVMNKITPADISDPQEVITRAQALSLELGTPITPGFEALVFKASRGIEDIYELTYIRKDGSRFPAVVSVTALRDTQDAIIGYLLIGTDNTARKQAEEALLKAGALQRAIFNSANFSSIATDAKGVIQIFNVGAQRMLGYTAAEMMNKVTPADISDPQEVISRAQALSLELGTPITPGFEALVFKASRGIEDIYELTYIRKDGRRFPAVVSVTALRDAQDAIIGYLLIGTDNTARKQAEEALLKAGALQRAIFNSANFSSIATDAKGVIQIFNVGAERMLGFAAAEVMNKITPADISDPQEVVARAKALSLELGAEIKPGFEALVFKASRGIEDIYELTYIRRDGSRFPAVVSVTALRDAQEAIIGYLLIGTDNTARTLAEEARRMSEARVSGIVNSAMDAIISIDSAQNIVLFNAAAETMFGCTAGAALGRPLETFIPERFRQQHCLHVENFGKTGVTSRSMRSLNALSGRRSDGEEFPIEASISQIEFAGKRIYTVILRDITQRRQAEDKVRLLNAELEQRVTQRTTQLQTANTELKASDESLFFSEERYRSLVESVKEYAILILDTQGNITTWNDGAQRIKGYSAEEIIGEHFSIFYPSEDAALGKPERELKVAMETGQYEEDGWRVRKGGARYWANVVITVLRDRHGTHLGFSKIVRDLTDRKNAEEKLRESEEWLRSLVEGGKKYAIVTLDVEGNVTTWNAGAERIKGYRADEIIGKHMSLFYPAEDVKGGKPQKELKIASETGQYEEDGWRVRKDGSLFWANVLLTVLRDSHGKHLGFSKVTRDLTDTVRAEEQARSFFTVSLEMLCIAGFDGYFKLLNPVWEQTLGFTPQELCAEPFRDFIHPDDLAATDAAAHELSTGKLLNHFENRYRCKDGSYRWLAWSVAVSADMQLMYAAAADITQRRRTEREIVSLNEALLRQNLELDSTNKELESFSYSVSHDLRAPLRAIDGFSQALSEDCAQTIDAEGQDNLGRIRKASQRMGQLIDDLLNLSRLNRVAMNRETIDLSKMAREVIEELRASDPERRVNCVIAEGLAADGDSRLLRVVLTNLFSNAWKFTSKGSNSRFDFGRSTEDGKEAFFVRDNGAGFDMAYAGKLFGAFQRMHAMQEFPGTGIGLATVQRIIHRHGGRIWADSTVGAGATFHFTL